MAAPVNSSDLFAQTHLLAQLGVSQQNTPNYIPYLGGAAFTATLGTIQTGTVAGPDGTTSADSYTDNGSAGVHKMVATAATTVVSGTWVSLVGLFKAGTFNQIAIAPIDSATWQAVVDIKNGTVVSIPQPVDNYLLQRPVVSVGVRPATNPVPNWGASNSNWYWVDYTFYAHAATTGLSISWALYANAGVSYTGASTVCWSAYKPVITSWVNTSENAAVNDVILLSGRNTQ